MERASFFAPHPPAGRHGSGVDLSKLKRGEADYAQFLDELRKADPAAFDTKK